MSEEKSGIVKREAEPLVPDAENLSKLSKLLLTSGMWPNLKTEAAIFAVVEYGRELGIPPVAALNTMAIVNGRLTMEAKALLAVANQRASVTWKVESLTGKGCTMSFLRPGFEPLKVSFDEADAQAAGLLTKTNWKTYAKDMYFARCASRGIRQIAPDAVLGLYSIEEMSDVIMPAEGEIIEVKPESQPEQGTPDAPTEEKQAAKEEARVKQSATIPKAVTHLMKEEGESKATELSKIKAEISSLFDQLTEKYFRSPDALLEAIHTRLQQVFKVSRAKIPDDLTEKEAVLIRNALKNTLDAEEEEEKNKEKIL